MNKISSRVLLVRFASLLRCLLQGTAAPGAKPKDSAVNLRAKPIQYKADSSDISPIFHLGLSE